SSHARKMAVLSHSGPRMAALMSRVTYFSPALTVPGGCSLTDWLGTIQDTAGRRPRRAAVKECASEAMLWSWWSSRTVVNHGSGFQIPGVWAFCGTGLQDIASSAQSGSEPLET